MYSVLILSAKRDFVDSIRSSLIYASAEDLKFLFFSDIISCKEYLVQFGVPDLILYDPKMPIDNLGIEHRTKLGKLTENNRPASDEVSIYQSIEHFMQSIKRLICNEPKSSGKLSKGKSVWVLAPVECDWSKRCFAEILNHIYTDAGSAFCTDASYLGNRHINLPQRALCSLSDLLMPFYGVKERGCYDRIEKRFTYIESVRHPMDLLSFSDAFYEQDYLKRIETFEQHFIYSGFLPESLVKAIVRSVDRVCLVSGEGKIHHEKLCQIKEWLSQMNPKLEVAIFERNEASVQGRPLFNEIITHLGLS